MQIHLFGHRLSRSGINSWRIGRNIVNNCFIYKEKPFPADQSVTPNWSTNNFPESELVIADSFNTFFSTSETTARETDLLETPISDANWLYVFSGFLINSKITLFSVSDTSSCNRISPPSVLSEKDVNRYENHRLRSIPCQCLSQTFTQ